MQSMHHGYLGRWGAAAVFAAVAVACGKTDSDSASDTGPSGGDGGAAAGASGADQGGSGGVGATSSGGAAGTGGTTDPPMAGAAGVVTTSGCPEPGESRNVGFSVRLDPLPPDPSGDSTLSEGMYPCVIVVPEYENDTMVLHLDCDQMMDTDEPLRATIGISADPDPDWGAFEAGLEVDYRWRVDTHGWRLYNWASLVERDSGSPLLIAYHTGSEFEPDRLEPFQALVLTDQCDPLQESCYRAEPQALALGDDDGNSLTLFSRSTGLLGSHQIWAGPLEVRSDFQCTDIPPHEYGVLVILEPPG